MDLGTNSLVDTKGKGISKDGSEVLNLESSENKKLQANKKDRRNY